jgi:hypothetical protein
VCFSPGGRTLVSAGYDKTVRLWELASGREVAHLDDHRDWVWGAAFAPDGRTVATASKDTTVRLWRPDAARGTRTVVGKLTAAQLEELWADLAGDASVAYSAIWTLAEAGEPAVTLLRERLRSAPSPPALKEVPRLITELDADDFQTREKASAMLEQIGRPALLSLRKALEGNPSLEARRRLEELLQKLDGPEPPPERLRAQRALHVLVHIGSAPARQALEALSQGPADDELTQEAKAALAELGRRPG